MNTDLSAWARGVGIWWPVVFGTAVGVEIMLIALLVFGPAQVQPEVAGQLTKHGVFVFRPERDVAIYVAGCLLTALLIGAFCWLWAWRCARIAAEARPEFLRQGCGQLALVAAMFLVHLGLLLVIKRWFMFEVATLPALPVFVLAAPVMGSLWLATAKLWRNFPALPGWLLRLLSSSATPCKFLKPASNPGADLFVSLVLCAIIYIPGWRNVAGQCFLADEFHHWNFFAMAPTLAFHYGHALGTGDYAQYGVGWPMLFSALSGLMPITYGRFIQSGAVCACVYFVGVYSFLRLMVGGVVWAAAGVTLALSLQTFRGVDPGAVLWIWPSSTVMRSPLDIWFFIALLLLLRTGRGVWVLVAGALVGLAILFETDTGIYLALACLAGWLLSLDIGRQPPLAFSRRLLLAVTAGGVAALVLLAGLAAASRGTLWRREFWAGWLESMSSYSAGLGLLPIANVPNATLLFFAVTLIVYFAAFGLAWVKLLRRECTSTDMVVGCLACYGLLVLILFVGRSHPFNLFHPSVPFSLIVTILAARLHQRVKGCASGSPPEPETKKSHVVERLVPWCVLGCAAVGLFGSRAFQDYPGALRMLFCRAPAEGLRLLQDPPDVSGLPPAAEGAIQQFTQVVSGLRARVAAGQTVAVLDHSDTLFYLATGTAPWWRYSPVLPAMIKRSQLADLQRALILRGPQWVVIRGSGLHAQLFGEEDVWQAVYQSVESCYRREETVGMFELWKRKGT
jgi:hypothetical protein